MKRDIYEAITERFIEQLKQGSVPWQKPWRGVQNLVSRKQYRGINSLLLGSTRHQSPFWLTYRQAIGLGGHIKKGERSLPVIYYKFIEKRDDAGNIVYRKNGAPARIPFIRWSNVFNLGQAEGITPPAIEVSPNNFGALDKAAHIVGNARLCLIEHGGYSALYSPTEDKIRMPAPETFYSAEGYFHVLYHEMTHGTGHSSRLDREGVTQPVKFGSDRYAKEELVAELGAAFLSNEAGILDQVRFENSAAYLESWIAKFEKDPRLIVSAAARAQESTDFIMGATHKESLEEPHLSPEGISHTWAREHGLEPRLASFAHADPDGDGLSNLAEWQHGTHPWKQNLQRQGQAL